MWLVLLLYSLMASTFTIGKIAVSYIMPVFFIGIRMIIGGMLLLLYTYFFNKKHWRFSWSDWWLFTQIVLFHIYCSYIFEFWGLQYLSSSKVSLYFNFSPFVTALFSYFLLSERLSHKKWIGLFIGFVGMIPLMVGQSNNVISGGFLSFSWADLAIMFSVICSAYGWMVMHELVVKRRYVPFMVNGFGMFIGGIAALLTSAFVEGWPPALCTPISVAGTFSALLEQSWGCYVAALVITALSVGFLIIVGNIICYNLYGFLLHRYSATFISFAGFTTPIFTAIYGWFLLGERVSISFVLCLILLSAGLYLFYQDELGVNKKGFQ